MRVEVQAGSPESVESDVLAAPLVAEEGLSGPLAALNGTLGGLLARLAEQGEITGKLKTAPFVHVEGELKAARLALPGIGAREAVDADALRTAAGTLAHEARGYVRTIAWLLDDSLPLAPAEQARAIVDGTLLGAYDPGRWKSSPEPQRLESLVIVSDDVAVKEAARRAGIVAEWANHARDLANSPPNELTPNGLADRAAEVGAAGSPYLSVEAPGLDEIRALGMGAFAAVAQGSHNPARLIVVRYEPPEPRGDVVLVLADVLPYARQLGATHLVDFATLTGAMERALGDFYAGVFANDSEWRTLVIESGEASGDHAWPWPLHSRYRRYVDSDYADMKNSNIRSQGVPVLAAEFLREFAGDGPWAHVDIAGTGFLTWPRHDYLWQRGGTGYGVRLICELADRLAASA